MTFYNSWILIASLAALFGILIDIMLSLYAYSLNPSYFILNESNKEFVAFFLTGAFPFFTFLSPLSIIVIHFIQRFFSSRTKNQKFLLALFNLYVINMVWICVTRIFGGLTWFVPILRGNLLDFMKFYGFALFLIYSGVVVLSVAVEEGVITLKSA